MLISDGGTVIRMAVDDIRRSGRATQGVIVMRPREGEKVATLAPVVGSDEAAIEPVPKSSRSSSSEAEAGRPPSSILRYGGQLYLRTGELESLV